MKKFLLSCLAVLLISTAKADEGMWMLPLLQKLNINEMQEKGLNLSAEDIYSINNSSLKDAIVIFGRGCTGELISDQGLILTNHHCGYGVIQQHSSVDHDYLKDGFWAKSMDEEIASPGLSVTFLRSIEDVTEKVLSNVNETMSHDVYNDALDSTITALKKNVEKDSLQTVTIKSFFSGNKFYQFVYEKYTDVRFVGAPPSSIGKFGADTDNWMWPRHTGDFSLFRVYANKDGRPAAYSEDNVPLKPKHHLPISLQGVKMDDFAMTMGFPGSTDRYLTSWGIDERINVINEARIVVRKVKQDIWLSEMQKNQKVRIQYASKYARSSNYYKNSIGMNRGLIKLDIPSKKEAIESEFKAWVNSNKSGSDFKDALPLLETAYKARREDSKNRYFTYECLRSGTEIFTFARMMGAMIPKNDSEQMLKSARKFYKDYYPTMDKDVLPAMLSVYTENIPSNHPEFITDIKNQTPEGFTKYANKLFKKSIFADSTKLFKAIEKQDWKKLRKDKAFIASVSIKNHEKKLTTSLAAYDGDINKGKRLFEAGLQVMNSCKTYYPDANFTLRLSYGVVGDYIPRDAVYYSHFTTLKGVMEKEDPNNWEFVVPTKLKTLYNEKDYGMYADKDGTMHVCFTTNNDITGGNSGSPVINGKGHLFGLAFDGNWEAMSGDIAFEPELQKCINVDIRYVLFIIDKYAGASNLIEEMTLIR